jgi:hypothetical protein
MESAKCVMKLKHEELYSIEIATKANGYRWRRNILSV